MDKENFNRAVRGVFETEKTRNGIGTYSESTLHAVLKNYYEPDPERHELEVGKYVADIVGEDGIIEIQTRQLFRLKEKLRDFLSVSAVTVVCPVVKEKNVVWRNTDTGEIIGKRKSPKHESIYTAMTELYSLREFIKEQNFRFVVPVITADDYKDFRIGKNGRKTEVRRFDRVPSEIIAEETFSCARDYSKLIPDGLNEVFTSENFAKAARIPRSVARTVLCMLYELHLVNRINRDRKGWTYSANGNQYAD